MLLNFSVRLFLAFAYIACSVINGAGRKAFKLGLERRLYLLQKKSTEAMASQDPPSCLRYTESCSGVQLEAEKLNYCRMWLQ